MEENRENKPKKQLKNYVRFTGAAFQMAGTIVATAFLGVWLDKKFNAGGNMWTLICTLTGVVVSMYIIIKEVIDMSKEKDNE
ncbi:AtpZ/AtpI family protein [uncultured Fluviicola sp.]|jgi:F0F1-type ATP synthase assembly protein I|uniref:AtpZ/AtpI family protein n=1 Tax=uncultured Fluviicola sp. TaxID=463303 RepID=UPI0025E357BB|nr:AtpZ/AtpI family protein [uncultured Fluviicola sp.]